MKRRLVFDIEANHYRLDLLKVIHCIAAIDVDTKEEFLFGPDRIAEGIELLNDSVLIGHNIIRYDCPALKLMYPQFNYELDTLWDTVIMSRMAKPKWFTHSLARWGQTLRFAKGDYAEKFKEAAGDSYKDGDEWAEYNPAMGEYCMRDVRVNLRVFKECCKAMPYMYTEEALRLEQFTTSLMERQKEVGVAFDKTKATHLMLKLMDRRDELAEELSHSFTGFYKRGKPFVPKRDHKRLGYKAGSPSTKIIWTEFNPGSNDHIAYWFKKKYKWEPDEFTDSGKPKISMDILEDLARVYPEAKPLEEYAVVSKRLSQISEGKGSWFNNLTEEGRIHGSVNAQGTVTYRGTHNNPNLGQVPKVGKPYGGECRELFSHGYGPDWSFMGCDMSGIEFRLLAHYLYQFDGGELVDTVLNGDIHSVNQRAAGLPTRDLAKTFILNARMTW